MRQIEIRQLEPGQSEFRRKPKRKGSPPALLLLLMALTALTALAALMLTGCSEKEEDVLVDMNMPYEPDTPAPAPHEGVFKSEHGTMTFPGDGESVILNFDRELAEALGLPEGEQEAKYVFMSGYLAPHGHVPVRYDVAFMIRLVVGEGDSRSIADVDIGLYENGSFFTGTNCTTPDRITFFVEWEEDADTEAVDFLKQ